MSIRKQSLEEWFTDHQLMALTRAHHYVPIDVEIDVTRIVSAYARVGRRAPLTAIVVKAAGLLAASHPEVNRAVLRTPLGTRVVQLEEAHVNLPVSMMHEGRRLLSAIVLRTANARSVDDLEAQMKSARDRKIDDLPIMRRLARRENTVAQRAALSLRHFLAYSVPSLYERHGGGISVSSVIRPAPEGVVVRIPAYGPTAFSLCPGGVRTRSGKTTLFVGIGYDHTALPGQDALFCADALGSLLATGDPAHFGPSGPSPFVPTTSIDAAEAHARA